MSYSSETKEELCRLEPDSVCCLLAELSGIISAAGSVVYRGGGQKRLSIETENSSVARPNRLPPRSPPCDFGSNA